MAETYGLKQFAGDLAAETRQRVEAAIDTAMTPLRAKIVECEVQIAELRAELETLKAQRPLKDAGVWKAGVTYHTGDMVSFQGSAWIAKTVNVVRPNDPDTGPSCWRLFVKRGADGKDGRDGRDVR